ncbi:MAG: hypothetical protein K8R31_12060 [Bacteroidales bacterium]|nr:hypothetical protein [Bacteroidales bacterium]
MKKTLTILALVLSQIVFGQSISKQLEQDTLINKFFNKSEIESISKLIESYDNWILSKTGETDINSGYHLFFGEVDNCESSKEFIDKVSLSKTKLDSIFLYFDSKHTLPTFWELEINRKINQFDTISVSLRLNSFASYSKYLNELSDKESFIKDYLKSIDAAGGISPSLVAGLGKHHDKFDFSEIRWRLFYTIHFMTVSYQVTFHKINL